MKIKEVVATLEEFAPLPLQDGYDNAGLQVGLTEAEVSGVLLCLDVTEAVLAEAAAKGCNLVVAHHPLLFRGLKQVGDTNYVERCVRMAVKNDITIYAAHTNLDNARGGVSFEMASRLGLKDVDFLQPDNKGGGSGVVAKTECPVVARDFVAKVKSVFGAECVMCNAMLDRPIGKVAICGGAGDFLLSRAIEVGADAFITGEMHYHLYFGHEQDIQIIVVGHYQSEQYTMQLFDHVLRQRFCDLKTFVTSVNTNPIIYV